MKIFVEASAIKELENPDCLSIVAVIFRNGGRSSAGLAIEFIDNAPKLLEALILMTDLASQEWQENGQRKTAKDNLGHRMWFISDEIMSEARTVVSEVEREITESLPRQK